jgi:hypothetical protein
MNVCAALGTGVLTALTEIFCELARERRRHGELHRATFEQAVTVVYRLLFLLFAEARALVPTWHHVYREAYTIDALCRRTLTQPSRPGAWKAVQAISRLAHHGCRAGDLVVTPFNGRLFSPRHTPLAERRRLSDHAVSRAIVALATTPGRGARERIAYGDLGVEQLGAVYERVLEYEPVTDGASARLTRTSLDRKCTGSFYTPRSVTDFLVRRALHPLVTGKSADELLRLRVLDPAMGSGAFLVAACRYLGDAVERALVLEGTLPSEHTNGERNAIRRLVAQRCVFGVDVNPMAVQLARLSLWLATLSSDRPLSFLDHHLATGDSLIGASFANLAREPFGTRSSAMPTLPLFDADTDVALARQILPERFRLSHDPDDSAAAVRAKEQTLARLTAEGTPLGRWKDAANLWCAAWFWDSRLATDRDEAVAMTRGVYRDVLASLLGHGGALSERHRDAVMSRARTLADALRFFHWELEFPEIFFSADGRPDPQGGFDAVIGNPPWDVLRADAGDQQKRDESRTDYRATLRFLRHARIYRHQGGGHVNRYQLFVERALQLLKPGGRLALIVPSGLATDHGSSALRQALFNETHVDRVLGFDNRRAIFPIHRDVRFLLVTARKGESTERLVCRFGQSDPQALDELPDDASDDPQDAHTVAISRAVLEQWDQEHVALPWVTRRTDFELLSLVHSRVPALSAAEGWQVKFGRELNATEDREHFVIRTADERSDVLPVIEGKHLEPFRALLANGRLCIPRLRAGALVDADRSFGRARIAYRDVASATNRLTLIAARLPPGTISTHTIFCSQDTLGVDAQYCLLALLNSLVANYLVRLRVTTHVTTAVMARLCVPRPAQRSSPFQELARLARALERTGLTGHDDTYARLNAIAAQLYGLTHEQYEHVVSTFPLLPQALRAHLLAAHAAHVQAAETQRTQR